MKILLTGATGFIGQHLTEKLIEAGHTVHAIVRNSSDPARLNPLANAYIHDETAASLIDYFEREHFDGVIHLASLFLATHTADQIGKLIASNVTFGTVLLEASKTSKVKWFINTGTFWQHYRDRDYDPVNLYAATKEAFEKIAAYYSETSGLIFTTLKLNDTFGPDDTRNKIFNLWEKNSQTDEVLEMSGGEQLIDISYIDDVVSAYLKLTEHLSSEHANDFRGKSFAVISASRMSLKDLACKFEKATGKRLNIVWGARPYREREVMVPWTKGKPVPGWKPRYTLHEAIQKTSGAQHD
ncbi:MAG: NAD-dependent epimerase/dehydratase family protein [Campylobacterota bacterium]